MPGVEVLPTHAYVPGQSARHPDGAFDAIRDTAQLGMTVEELARSDAFLTGLDYLDRGYFWETHELLEPVWMALPEDSDERRLVQALIQIANGFLKLRMQRPNAAKRLSGIARGLLPESVGGSLMGVAIAGLHQRIDQLQDEAE